MKGFFILEAFFGVILLTIGAIFAYKLYNITRNNSNKNFEEGSIHWACIKKLKSQKILNASSDLKNRNISIIQKDNGIYCVYYKEKYFIAAVSEDEIKQVQNDVKSDIRDDD